MAEFQIPPTNRSSVERDNREKSLSDERSVSQTIGGTGSKGKVKVEIEKNTQFIESLGDYDLQGFQMRPNFGEKFSPTAVESLIENVLKEFFVDKKEYDFAKASDWVELIGKELTLRVRELNFPRYKFVSHVTLGEHIGGGIHVGMKCFWDAETDLYASYTYLAENIFCVATISGVFYY